MTTADELENKLAMLLESVESLEKANEELIKENNNLKTEWLLNIDDSCRDYITKLENEIKMNQKTLSILENVIVVDKDLGIGTVSGKRVYNIMRFFRYEHLPPNLQDVSKPFHDLAEKIADQGKDSAETLAALRKLLEAKDAAVRSVL